VPSSANPDEIADTNLPLTEEEKEQVRRALNGLLQSPPLKSTVQCQQLLRYIVEHTMSGDRSLLRERVIGKEVFGRRPDYEPGEDPVVRIRAADLRKRLALYYQATVDIPEPKIDVPSGSYRATFTWQREKNFQTSGVETQYSILLPGSELQSAPLSSPPILQADPPAAEKSWFLKISTGKLGRSAAALLSAILVLLGGLYYHRQGNDPVQQFWGPMLSDSKPVLISIGSNAVYRVGEHEIDEYITKAKLDRQSGNGMEIFPPLRPEQSFASTGLYPAPESFVALGDVAASSEIVRTLTRYGKDFEERFPNDISFGEVHEHPSILIGGANNPITRDLTRNLPFVRRGRNRIEDRDHPDKGWELHASTDLHDTDDYAIITRLLGKEDASAMVSVAGMGAHGTLAAAEFLCRPEHVRVLRDQLGPDWLKHNFQAVLHIKIIDFRPVSMDIVAFRQW
jgi:hypothetical protein